MGKAATSRYARAMSSLRSSSLLLALALGGTLIGCPSSEENLDPGPDPTIETEPEWAESDDSATRPTRMGWIHAGETVEGNFGSTSRYLAWSFRGNSGDVVHLTAHGVTPANLDTVLILYRGTSTGNPSGAALALNDNYDGMPSSYLEYTLSDTRVYTAVIRRRDRGATGRIELAYDVGGSTSACRGLAEGAACEDGDRCTTSDRCMGGTCRGTTTSCPSTGTCAVGSCNPVTGACVQTPVTDGTTCDDTNFCTSADVCRAGVCAGTMRSCPTSTDQCVVPACNPGTGECGFGNAPDGTSCDDSNGCTTADSCRSGGCFGGPRRTCTPSSGCATAHCSDVTGLCVETAAMEGATCDDGSLCTSADRCADGTCRGTAVSCGAAPCHVAMCSPTTGMCMDMLAADGVSCDDGNSCTTADHCTAGSCTGTLGSCTASIEVHVVNEVGAGLTLTPVSAYRGTTEVARIITSPSTASATFTLPAGSYRFRVSRNGIPTWSGATDHCTVGTCSRVDITAAGTSPTLRAVTWEGALGIAYMTGTFSTVAPRFTQNGIYVENWAINDYLRPTVAWEFSHDHTDRSCFDPPNFCGNTGLGENQHAYQRIQQGMYVRLPDNAPFDLVSIDYRVRNDVDATHVNEIPGFDGTTAEVWLSTTLTLATAPPAPWTRIPVGTVGTEMTEFRTLDVTGFNNVTQVFISSTWNTSFDNIVVRPR